MKVAALHTDMKDMYLFNLIDASCELKWHNKMNVDYGLLVDRKAYDTTVVCDHGCLVEN